MQTFDDYYNQVKQQAELSLDPTWGQGKTTFGGMSAALALAAIEQQHPQDAELRSLSVNFCGALATNIPFTTQTRILKAGRSVQHLMAEIHQNNECTTIVSACYGAARKSDIVVPATTIEPGVEGAGQRLTYIPGITPEFVQHVDFSYLSGGIPFSNSPHNHIHGWMRFSDCSSILTNVHLVVLIDAWPPTTLQKLKQVAPCASITWNLEIITPLNALEHPLTGDSWLYYEANIEESHAGYAHTTARVFSPTGLLLALSRQLVVVYDRR